MLSFSTAQTEKNSWKNWGKQSWLFGGLMSRTRYYITVLVICNKNMFLSGNIPTQEVYDNSKAAMRASFGHMERPDNSEYRPTVETIHSMLRSI